MSNEFAKRDLLNSAREVVNASPRTEGRRRIEQQLYLAHAHHWAPLLFIIAIWIFMRDKCSQAATRRCRSAVAIKLLNNQQKRVTFKDVAGVEEAKEGLQEIIEFLKEPQEVSETRGPHSQRRFDDGTAGNWQDVAGPCDRREANVPFFSISGSDFVEMFVGVGASRVRDY